MAYEELKELTGQVIGSAINVHKAVGPGFTERMYAKALQLELQERNVPFVVEEAVRVKYKGRLLGIHRLDLVVNESVVVELKAVYQINNFHVAQMLSYLKASGRRLGHFTARPSELLSHGERVEQHFLERVQGGLREETKRLNPWTLAAWRIPDDPSDSDQAVRQLMRWREEHPHVQFVANASIAAADPLRVNGLFSPELVATLGRDRDPGTGERIPGYGIPVMFAIGNQGAVAPINYEVPDNALFFMAGNPQTGAVAAYSNSSSYAFGVVDPGKWEGTSFSAPDGMATIVVTALEDRMPIASAIQQRRNVESQFTNDRLCQLGLCGGGSRTGNGNQP